MGAFVSPNINFADNFLADFALDRHWRVFFIECPYHFSLFSSSVSSLRPFRIIDLPFELTDISLVESSESRSSSSSTWWCKFKGFFSYIESFSDSLTRKGHCKIVSKSTSFMLEYSEHSSFKSFDSNASTFSILTWTGATKIIQFIFMLRGFNHNWSVATHFLTICLCRSILNIYFNFLTVRDIEQKSAAGSTKQARFLNCNCESTPQICALRLTSWTDVVRFSSFSAMHFMTFTSSHIINMAVKWSIP